MPAQPGHEPPELVQRALAREAELEQSERFARLKRLHRKAHSNPISAFFTKVLLTLVGGFFVLAGIVMLVGPGQGVLAILFGLAILAVEWPWAERLLRRLRERLHEARVKAAALDPKTRRRRILLTVLAVIAAAATAACFIGWFGWPSAAVSSWHWLQSFAGFLPDLPGM